MINIRYYLLILLLTQQITYAQITNQIVEISTNIDSLSNNIIDNSSEKLPTEVIITTNEIDSLSNNIILTNSINNTNITIVPEEEDSHIEDGDFSVPNIFRALIASYPHIVKRVLEKENPYYPDLAISVRGTNFYDVKGRFLPEEERKNWNKYNSNTIYTYPIEIPDPSKRTKKEISRMKKQGSKFYRKRKKPTYYGFHEALYGMSQLADTNTQIMKANFLGKQVLIHQLAHDALKQVEKEIYALTNDAIYSTEVKKFLKEGSVVYSFFWRTIAGSKSRSLHSYGVAVDVLEENSIKAMYWLWRQNLKIDWIREPISVRWNPPNSVVQIFEKYGFVWGGKWNFYDTMHFEYKPEILILNGYDVIFLNQEAKETHVDDIK